MAGEALREKLEAADARRAALEAEEEAKVPLNPKPYTLNPEP